MVNESVLEKECPGRVLSEAYPILLKSLQGLADALVGGVEPMGRMTRLSVVELSCLLTRWDLLPPPSRWRLRKVAEKALLELGMNRRARLDVLAELVGGPDRAPAHVRVGDMENDAATL